MTDSIQNKPWQAKISRRRFIGAGAAMAGAAAMAGYLPESVMRAAASPAKNFDLSQVKHLVFVMQENRSFDHYFGTRPGVAGFSDPHAIRLPNGNSVFQQPDPQNPDGWLEPFHMSTITTGAAAVPDLTHNWQPQHASWNGGLMDSWLRTHIAFDGPRVGPYTMGYYIQEDIPFHWALADAFTLCDQYHCSVMGPTDPNRMFWQNGTNDPAGMGGGPVLETATPPPLTFESGAETMQKAGISVKTYLGGGAPGTWPFFANFQSGTSLPPGQVLPITQRGTLFGDGTPGGIGDPANPVAESVTNMAFEEDCANGVLADVSFLGTTASEHPPAIPAGGAQYLAQVVDALAANEDLWNTTLLFIQYDENDGFFDHVVPPTPNFHEFPEEFVTKSSAAGTPGGGLPIGAGFRVPGWMVSPWSVGGKVFSEVSDHTSCLRLIEAVSAAGGLSNRGAVHFPFISRWRRQTFSNLTGSVGGPAKPAPSSPEFDPTQRATELAAQTASSKLPQAPFPGAAQTKPSQPRH